RSPAPRYGSASAYCKLQPCGELGGCSCVPGGHFWPAIRQNCRPARSLPIAFRVSLDLGDGLVRQLVGQRIDGVCAFGVSVENGFGGSQAETISATMTEKMPDFPRFQPQLMD